MKSLLHLKPGQKGTKKLLEEFGDRLLCVRYRYDEKSKERLKTVEIVVSRKPWPPLPPGITEDSVVFVRIGFEEHEERAELRALGGKWDATKKLWTIRYGNIRGTRFEGRMAPGTPDTTPKKHPK